MAQRRNNRNRKFTIFAILLLPRIKTVADPNAPLEKAYPTGVKVPCREMKLINERLERSNTLPKYDIIIKLKSPRGR